MRVERRVRAVDGIGAVARRGGSSRLFDGRKLSSSRIIAQAFGVVVRHEVGHAAGRVVRHRAAQLVLGDFFVRDGLDHVRPGDEHVARSCRTMKMKSVMAGE